MVQEIQQLTSSLPYSKVLQILTREVIQNAAHQ